MDKSDKKDMKYSIIGELLLRIIPSSNSNVSTKQNILSNYLATTPKKQIFKDIWFGISMIMFIYLFFWVLANKEYFSIPKVTDKITGITLEGNCTFIRERYNAILESRNKRSSYILPESIPTLPNITMNIRYNTINTTTITCPTIPTTMQTTTTTLICPDCNCQCPPCETKAYTGLSRPKIKASLNIRPGPNNSPAYSGGCYDCLEQMWSIAEIPVCAKEEPDKGYCIPRFRSGIDTGYYNSIMNKTSKTCTVNFLDEDCDGKFKLNNSIWAIFGNGSIKTIYKMD